MLILLGNILGGLAFVLGSVITIAIFLIIISAVISWVNPDPYNPIVRFLNESTEPMLRPLRRYIPLIQGRIDISPIVLLLLLYFLQYALVKSLSDFSDILVGMGKGYSVPASYPVAPIDQLNT